MKQLLGIFVWFGVGVALTALFWPGFWTGKGLIGGDLYTYFFPQKLYYAERLADGELPLWNPLVGHGYPLVAESQTGVFYPPHLLAYPLLDLNTAYPLLQLLHFALAFGFTVALARTWGFSRLPSALAGVVFVYGWFPARITLEWAILTGAWMPAALWCVEKILTTSRWRYALGLAFVIAVQMLAGHFHLAFITQVLLVAYAAGRLLLTQTNPSAGPTEASTARHRLMSFGVIAMALGLGFGLAAVQLAPSWELKARSQRSSVGTHYNPGDGHIPPWYLKQIVVPFLVYGTVGDLNDHLPAGSPSTNAVEAHLYFGLVPLGLVLYGVLTGVYWRDRRWWLWLLFGALAMAYSTGVLLPITKFLPGFHFFRGVGRWGIITTLAVAALSGAALDAWKSRRRPGVMIGIFMVVVLALTIWDLRTVRGIVGDGIFVETPAISFLDESPVRKELAAYPEPVRLFCRGANLPTLLGVASTPVYLGIGPDEYVDPNTAMPEPLPFDGPPTPEQIDWLRRAGVTHILSFSTLDESVWPVELVWEGFDPFLNRAWGRGPGESFSLYQLSGSRGRVSWLGPDLQNPKPAVEELSANRVVIKADAVQAGTLILTDLAYPGWEVTVDGEPADGQRFEGMYRSVELPPGEHTVIWEYRPASQRWGWITSGVSCLAIIVISLVRIRRSKGATPSKT